MVVLLLLRMKGEMTSQVPRRKRPGRDQIRGGALLRRRERLVAASDARVDDVLSKRERIGVECVLESSQNRVYKTPYLVMALNQPRYGQFQCL